MQSNRGPRRKFSRSFKINAIKEYEDGRSSAAVCRKYQIGHQILSRWVREYRANPVGAFSGNGKISTNEARIAELERIIGRLTIENEILKKTLRAQREIEN